MEMELVLAPSVVYKDFISCYLVCTTGKFDQSGLKIWFWAIFDETSWILKYLAEI